MKTSNHIKKVAGFKIPEGYFENNAIDLSRLTSVEGRSGFKVPQDYFDGFTVEVPKETKPIRLYNYKSLAIAASLTILLATLLINLIGSQLKSEAMDFSKIDQQHLYDYIEDEMILDHDMYINGMDKNLKDFKNDISEEAVLDYLDDTNIEQLMDY